MKQPTLPSYTEFNKVLSKTTLKLNPSQAHGLVSGILCGNPENKDAWIALVTGEKSSKKTHELLQLLYENTEKQLSDVLFGFQLFMPDDKTSLLLRAEALTLWCQGFLTGLKLVQIKIIGREPGEVTEAIEDIIEIAKMNYEQVVDTEEDEAAYTELVEFVRVAIVMIYQNLSEGNGSEKKSIGTSDQLH